MKWFGLIMLLGLGFGCATTAVKPAKKAGDSSLPPYVQCTLRGDCEKNLCRRDRPHDCYRAPEPGSTLGYEKMKPGDTVTPMVTPTTPMSGPIRCQLTNECPSGLFCSGGICNRAGSIANPPYGR